MEAPHRTLPSGSWRQDPGESGRTLCWTERQSSVPSGRVNSLRPDRAGRQAAGEGLGEGSSETQETKIAYEPSRYSASATNAISRSQYSKTSARLRKESTSSSSRHGFWSESQSSERAGSLPCAS